MRALPGIFTGHLVPRSLRHAQKTYQRGLTPELIHIFRPARGKNAGILLIVPLT